MSRGNLVISYFDLRVGIFGGGGGSVFWSFLPFDLRVGIVWKGLWQ